MSATSAAALPVTIPLGAQETILGLTLTQWTLAGILFGMAIGLAGLVVNVYFQRKRHKLLEDRVDDEHPNGD